jgi:hypothetical protein
MFLLYHSERYNTSGTVFHWCYIRLAYYTMQWYAGSPHHESGAWTGMSRHGVDGGECDGSCCRGGREAQELTELADEA